MHELSITKRIIEVILEEVQNKKCESVKMVSLELGNLTTYSKNSILFYFDLLKKNFPIIKRSQIKIKEVKGKILCNNCGRTSFIKDPYLIFCNFCNSSDIAILQGKEFKIKRIRYK